MKVMKTIHGRIDLNIFNINKQRKKTKMTLKRDVDASEYYYVISDVNGEHKLLEDLIQQIHDDKEHPIQQHDTIVVMGPFIGVDTKETFNLLQKLENVAKCTTVFITSPLDAQFLQGKLKFMKQPEAIHAIKSYRYNFNNPVHARHGALDTESILEHRAWLEQRNSFFITDKFLFCYSGINPYVVTEKQNINALMFCKSKDYAKAFIDAETPFEHIVVHGDFAHNGTKPRLKLAKDGTLNRINVNSNVNVTGRLSCVVIDEDSCQVVKTYIATNKQREAKFLEDLRLEEEASKRGAKVG